MDRTPTIAQMVNRMNDGHFKVLRSAVYGESPDRPWTSAGELRGYRTAGRTLARWGAMSGGSVTDLGRELLDGYARKWGRR